MAWIGTGFDTDWTAGPAMGHALVLINGTLNRLGLTASYLPLIFATQALAIWIVQQLHTAAQHRLFAFRFLEEFFAWVSIADGDAFRLLTARTAIEAFHAANAR